jgi:Mor family transcriptional regulator
MKCGVSVLDFLEQTLRAVMGPERFSEAEALEVKLRLSREFGGGEVYVPKIQRDVARDTVRREFNGRNRKELCARFGLSRSGFYKIIKGD